MKNARKKAKKNLKNICYLLFDIFVYSIPFGGPKISARITACFMGERWLK